MSMLEIRDLEVNYGMIAAIKGVSFDVNEGEVIALIGANGAGKTTILHTITGLLKAKAGSIMFEGHELTKTPAHKIVELGMAHVPEGRRIFSHLTVLENLKLGAYTRKDKGGVAADLRKVYDRFPRLAEKADRGNPFRRRAADARHGARAYVKAAYYRYGRAFDGTFADICRRDIRHNSVDKLGRRDGSACRAERKESAFDSRSRICSRNG